MVKKNNSNPIKVNHENWLSKESCFFSIWGRKDNLKHSLQDILVHFRVIIRDAASSKQTETCENESVKAGIIDTDSYRESVFVVVQLQHSNQKSLLVTLAGTLLLCNCCIVLWSDVFSTVLLQHQLMWHFPPERELRGLLFCGVVRGDRFSPMSSSDSAQPVNRGIHTSTHTVVIK